MRHRLICDPVKSQWTIVKSSRKYTNTKANYDWIVTVEFQAIDSIKENKMKITFSWDYTLLMSVINSSIVWCRILDVSFVSKFNFTYNWEKTLSNSIQLNTEENLSLFLCWKYWSKKHWKISVLYIRLITHMCIWIIDDWKPQGQIFFNLWTGSMYLQLERSINIFWLKHEKFCI